MFKRFVDICDVVSLLVYCPGDHTFLLNKETSGEYWLPSSTVEKNCWKTTANKLYSELFGSDASPQCVPLRIYKIWLPGHHLTSVYHGVYKVNIKADLKKKTKMKLWEGTDTGLLIEISEEQIIINMETGAGAVARATPNCQLLQAASYSKDDQLRMYCNFLVLSYPALFMSPAAFTTFMMDIGWQRPQCANLFRAADITGRGGLSFLDMLLWCAATEPGTQHGGMPAEIRCRYIFRFFDGNRDMKLEYVEFKELIGASRAARQLPVDALSVARDADVILKQLNIPPNSQLQMTDFLRSVGELRVRGTSSMLRSPRSASAYLADLQLSSRDLMVVPPKSQVAPTPGTVSPATTAVSDKPLNQQPDYGMATYTVRVRKDAQNEMIELAHFDEDAITSSTTRLIAAANTVTAVTSLEVFGLNTAPVEAIAAVHYFATPVEKLPGKRISVSTNSSLVANKAAFTWVAPAEEIAMGTLLLKLADAVRPIFQAEPRLLKLSSPVYCIGDLHGNLSALLAMETALWPSGAALSPAKLLFLGDFVDRGPHGAEIMAYLLAAKLQRPKGVLLVRGNHEIRDIQKMFTFHTECVQKYGDAEGSKIWQAINNVFDVLPLAAVIDNKVFCCHGGIPPPWVCPLVTAIDKVPVPLTRPAEQSTIAWELLWNDPIKPNKVTATVALELTANEGFAANVKRGTGHVFDQMAIDRFLLANQLSHVVRAHELHQNGFMCQLRGRLISVFSSNHYCGGTNDCGVALLEGNKLRLMRVGGTD